jgi:hypothetical protein
MRVLARAQWSEVRRAPPRPGLAVPLSVEQTHPSLTQAQLDVVEAYARALARRRGPYRRVLEVRRTPDAVVLLTEDFLGPSGGQLVRAMAARARLLPFTAWLRVAVELIHSQTAAEGGPGPGIAEAGLDALGFDLHRRLVLFPAPRPLLWGHALEQRMLDAAAPVLGAFDDAVLGSISGRWGSGLSPEAVRGSPLQPASSVFSAAALLVELLTTQAPFRRAARMQTLMAVANAEARWSHAVHPGCPLLVQAVLRRALHRALEDRWPDLPAFEAALLEAAGVPPASLEATAAAALALTADQWSGELRELAADPSALPETWREGGLAVLEDELLEVMPPLATFPGLRGG